MQSLIAVGVAIAMLNVIYMYIIISDAISLTVVTEA